MVKGVAVGTEVIENAGLNGVESAEVWIDLIDGDCFGAGRVLVVMVRFAADFFIVDCLVARFGVGFAWVRFIL